MTIYIKGDEQPYSKTHKRTLKNRHKHQNAPRQTCAHERRRTNIHSKMNTHRRTDTHARASREIQIKSWIHKHALRHTKTESTNTNTCRSAEIDNTKRTHTCIQTHSEKQTHTHKRHSHNRVNVSGTRTWFSDLK